MAMAERFQDILHNFIFPTFVPDLVLAFAFFTSLVYAVLEKRFSHQRSAITMSAAIGLALALGILWWEQTTRFSLKDLGPFAVGFAVLMLAFVMYQAIRQMGGSWAGAAITLGVVILMASIFGMHWPWAPQVLQTITTIALVVGIMAFLLHYQGRKIPSSRLASADSRHDMSDLYRGEQLSQGITSRLDRLRRQAPTLDDNPQKSNEIMIQLKRILPAEGSLTERMARLRAQAHHMRNGHIARLAESRRLFARLPNTVKKKAAAELTLRYGQLAGIDTRLERLDKMVAQNEQRIKALTQEALSHTANRDYPKLQNILQAAEKLQHHNTKLIRIIERTEQKLSLLAQRVAQEVRGVNRV